MKITSFPRPRRLGLIVAVAAVALLVAAVGAAALAGAFDRRTTRERVAGGGTKVVRVALVDTAVGFDVRPNTLLVDRGTHLVLDVVNAGKERHDLALEGGATRTRMLDPGESQRLDLGRAMHDSDSWCTVTGHKLFGMSLAVHVVPPGFAR